MFAGSDGQHSRTSARPGRRHLVHRTEAFEILVVLVVVGTATAWADENRVCGIALTLAQRHIPSVLRR